MSFSELVSKDIQDLKNRGFNFTTDWFHYGIKNDISKTININTNQKVNILEIGAFEGKSTLWFIETYLQDPESRITVIDPFLESDETTNVTNETFDIFCKNMELTNQIKKIKHYRQKSREVLIEFNAYPKSNQFDIIFIDGSHLKKDIIIDILLTWDLLKIGGYMILDDYKSPSSAVYDCITFFLSCLIKKEYRILHDTYQLILTKLN